MRKIAVLITALILTALVGCGGLPESKDAAEKQVEKVARLKIVLNKDIVVRDRDFSVMITDKKIINDIQAMINDSTPLTDESVLKKLSGAITKDNRLVFTMENGNIKEVPFRFDGLYELGYVEVGGKQFIPEYDFFRYLRDFEEYKNYKTRIAPEVTQLFKKYNWTVDYRINTIKERLPSNLKHEAGEFPFKIYWAYNNELSKEIGMDFTEYLGRMVTVELYRLREPLPEFLKPLRNARGVVLKYNGRIIGAFTDAGRHDSFASSLNRKSLEEVTGKDWGSWVDDYIDYDKETDKKLSSMNPEEVIRTYFNALNDQDEKMLFAVFTRKSLARYLSTNMDNNKLYNRRYKGVFVDGYNNVKRARLLEIKKPAMKNTDGSIEYSVTADYEFGAFVTSRGGVEHRFVILKKETPRSGWRIDSIGSGP